MIKKFITVLFIQAILPNFFPGQILSAVRLKICPLRQKICDRTKVQIREFLFKTRFHLVCSRLRLGTDCIFSSLLGERVKKRKCMQSIRFIDPK